jgi:hypothetical protein
MTLQDKIISVAEGYLGQQEIPGNAGFVDSKFEAQMRMVGWDKGQSWCAYFTELVWKRAFGKPSTFAPALDKLFSPSATATWANFKGSNIFKTGAVPRPGALVVWRYGTGWQGHIGIVTGGINAATGKFPTIEGNTNASGAREGLYVMRKSRPLLFNQTGSGLNLIGFIYAP